MLFIHVLACLWFYTARLSDFNVYTWVTRYNQEDQAPLSQYVVSMYFVMTTLATVGLGDIVAYTPEERICAISLMLFGVAFFSYTISNVSTMLNSADSKSGDLKTKLDSLENFAKTVPLPRPLADRVAAHIRHNFLHESSTWQGRETLLRDLPLFLQSELGLFMYHRLVSKVQFFQDKDPNFICAIAPKLQVMCLKENQIVYVENSFPEEVYFLMKGRVVLRKEGINFLTYVPGSYFGELDLLWGRLRASSAYIEEEAEMLVLSKKHFLLMLEKFSSIKEEVLEVAHVREARNIKALKDALGFAATKEMNAYLRKPFSVEEQPKTKNRKSVRILKQKENNRIKWHRLNSLDQTVTPRNEWDEVLTRTRKARSRKLSRTPLVSAEEVFVPKEREAQWNIVRRKRKAVQLINRQDSTLPDVRVTPRRMQLTGVVMRVKQYESRVHVRMLKLEMQIQKVEAKHKELGEEILRLFT